MHDEDQVKAAWVQTVSPSWREQATAVLSEAQDGDWSWKFKDHTERNQMGFRLEMTYA
jgi:hypothetical protein